MLGKSDSFQSVVFSSDLLKIDDRQSNRFSNPQAINVRWLSKLLGPIFEGYGWSTRTLFGDEGREESIRWQIYDGLQLPLETSSWASLYFDVEGISESVADLLAPLRSSLWITFEAPPYLTNALNRNGATYIDCSIHPIRFLPDYLLGMRSNSAAITERLRAFTTPDDLVYDFARVSAARSTRVFQTELPADSAIFFGQISVDSSLIYNRTMAGIDEVRMALQDLKMTHECVYYKAHPHAKEIDALKSMVASMAGCHWIEVNAYDALASEYFATVATLSSGVATEARYFGKLAKKYLERPNYFDRADVGDDAYVPVFGAYLYHSFWDSLIKGKVVENEWLPAPHEGALKFNLNMKWGR